MPLEAAQLLSTCHRVYGSKHSDSVNMNEVNVSLLYALSHRNHPSSVWVRECKENYDWTYDYFNALCLEYKHRYGKEHASWTKLSRILVDAPVGMPCRGGMSALPCCMPDIYKISNDPVVNYKQYYRLGKAELHAWRNREQPSWVW
jgi:hypothetical protein